MKLTWGLSITAFVIGAILLLCGLFIPFDFSFKDVTFNDKSISDLLTEKTFQDKFDTNNMFTLWNSIKSFLTGPDKGLFITAFLGFSFLVISVVWILVNIILSIFSRKKTKTNKQ